MKCRKIYIPILLVQNKEYIPRSDARTRIFKLFFVSDVRYFSKMNETTKNDSITFVLTLTRPAVVNTRPNQE